MSNCDSPSATHHMACDCREKQLADEIATLRTRLDEVERERDEAQAAQRAAAGRVVELIDERDRLKTGFHDCIKTEHEMNHLRTRLAEVEKERDEQKEADCKAVCVGCRDGHRLLDEEYETPYHVQGDTFTMICNAKSIRQSGRGK